MSSSATEDVQTPLSAGTDVISAPVFQDSGGDVNESELTSQLAQLQVNSNDTEKSETIRDGHTNSTTKTAKPRITIAPNHNNKESNKPEQSQENVTKTESDTEKTEETEINNQTEVKEFTVRTEAALKKELHKRKQLVGKVHVAVVKYANSAGIIVDLIVYDCSGTLPQLGMQTKTHEDLIPLQSEISSQSISENVPRYVVSSLLPWNKIPYSIRSLPMGMRISCTMQFVPPGSVFNVYCDSVDSKSGYIVVKVANRSAPRIKLPTWIDKTLTHSSPVRYSAAEQGARPRFLIIIDFEATCDFSPEPKVDVLTSEIIEFPWVVLDTVTNSIVYERRLYVKPDNMEGITNYCTQLTCIKKEDCINGIPLRQAVAEFNNYIRSQLFYFGENNFRIVTDSVWDLQVQLRSECMRKNIYLEWWFTSYFDLREEFRHFYGWFQFLKRGPPLYIMLNAYDLQFVGRHHSGLDDCKTIAQIVKVLLQLHPNTFTKPKTIRPDYDPMKDNTWVSMMGHCPEDAWLCTNSECAVYNKPSLGRCQFCHAPRIN